MSWLKPRPTRILGERRNQWQPREQRQRRPPKKKKQAAATNSKTTSKALILQRRMGFRFCCACVVAEATTYKDSRVLTQTLKPLHVSSLTAGLKPRPSAFRA